MNISTIASTTTTVPSVQSRILCVVDIDPLVVDMDFRDLDAPDGETLVDPVAPEVDPSNG